MSDPYHEWSDRELVKDHEENPESFRLPINTTMTTITPNQEVNFHLGDEIPAGYYLHPRNDSRYAKLAKVQFVYCKNRVTNPAARGRVITIGLVVKDTDRARMDAAVALRGTLSKHSK